MVPDLDHVAEEDVPVVLGHPEQAGGGPSGPLVWPQLVQQGGKGGDTKKLWSWFSHPNELREIGADY